MRAKFKVDSITHAKDSSTVNLTPVVSGSKENEAFYRYTPGGSASLALVRPETAEQFEPGKEYYVDFTDASEPQTAVAGETSGPTRAEAMPVVGPILKRLRRLITNGLMDRGFSASEAQMVVNQLGDGTLLKLFFDHLGDIMTLIEFISKLLGK